MDEQKRLYKTQVDPVWESFDVASGSVWDRFCDSLKSIRNIDSVYDRFGLLDRLGIGLGTVCYRFGRVLGLLLEFV